MATMMDQSIDTMTISQLEYLAEGYRYKIQSTVEGAKITIYLRKLDESEDVSILTERIAPIGAEFDKAYRSTLAEGIESMIAYEHRKDNE